MKNKDLVWLSPFESFIPFARAHRWREILEHVGHYMSNRDLVYHVRHQKNIPIKEAKAIVEQEIREYLNDKGRGKIVSIFSAFDTLKEAFVRADKVIAEALSAYGGPSSRGRQGSIAKLGSEAHLHVERTAKERNISYAEAMLVLEKEHPDIYEQYLTERLRMPFVEQMRSQLSLLREYTTNETITLERVLKSGVYEEMQWQMIKRSIDPYPNSHRPFFFLASYLAFILQDVGDPKLIDFRTVQVLKPLGELAPTVWTIKAWRLARNKASEAWQRKKEQGPGLHVGSPPGIPESYWSTDEMLGSPKGCVGWPESGDHTSGPIRLSADKKPPSP